jgi:hypothetical protein
MSALILFSFEKKKEKKKRTTLLEIFHQIARRE